MPVKNYFALALFGVFITSITSAQQFGGGLRVGLVASEVSGDHHAGPTKPGLYASVFSNVPIGEYSDIMLEIMYIQKGSRSVPTERNNFADYQFYLQYAEIPLNIRTDIARFTDIGNLKRLTVNAGLSASVLVGYAEREMGVEIPASEMQDFFPAELNVILGISVPLYSVFDASIGFSRSLTPIRPHAGGGSTWYNKGQYNTIWTFGLSYAIW